MTNLDTTGSQPEVIQPDQQRQKATERKLATVLFVTGLVAFTVFIWRAATVPERVARPRDPGGKVLSLPGRGVWSPVEQFTLGNIVAVGFSADGSTGAAISSSANLVISADGGTTWEASPGPPISEGETISALAILADGELLVGTHIEESDFTGVYVRRPGAQWEAKTGPLGGLTGASPDGTFFAGGAGLCGIREGGSVSFLKVPDCAGVTFYAASGSESAVLTAGSDGLLARSIDRGANWKLHKFGAPLGGLYPQHLNAVAISSNTALVGGLNGALWRSDSQGEEWSSVDGLSPETMIAALYLDKAGEEAVAAGGDPSGTKPFVMHTSDAGHTWKLESVRTAEARITGVAKGRAGLFAATLDGYLLKRR